MFKNKSLQILLTLLLLRTQAQAALIFVNESDGTHDQAFFIDSGDASTDFIDLEFGASIDAKLRYEIANDQFTFNRDVDLGGNELQSARIENLAAAPTCDATQVGRIYHDTTTSDSFICSGTVFEQIDTVGGAPVTAEFAAVQARRTTVFNLSETFTDVDLDVTDLENDPAVLDHDDVLRDRINILSDGFYQIIYGYTAGGTAAATHEARAQVRVNDATVLSGSQSVNRNFQVEFSTTSASFLANLSAGDFISLQLLRDATVDTTQDEIFFSIVRLEGVPGATGAAGADGINGGDTDANVFIVDNDDTGGDVTVQFGATLNETLTWDDANARFNLSDTLRVAGNLEQDGNVLALDAENVGAGANVDIVANQGADNDGTLRYDATNNRWELSNDGAAFAPISTFEPSVFYGFDDAGGQTIGTAEATLNIDNAVISDPNYALAGDQVTVTEAGLYKITAELGLNGANTSGGQRTSIDFRIQESGVNIPGALTECYHRETEENGCSISILENVAAGGVIRLRVDRTGGTSVVTALPDASRLLIEKVR